jgi:AraC family transcriptional regulator
VEEFTVQTLLSTPTVTVTDVVCWGACRHKSDEEWATETHLVFPYRGVCVRHIGRDDAVAEANQVQSGPPYRQKSLTRSGANSV